MSVHLLLEIERLKKRVLHLGAMVEESVRNALLSIEKRDPEYAAGIIRADTEIDRAEVDLEEDCLKCLALYQPVAGDLRFIIAILKINSDLERIGDLAVNIAERTEYLARHEKLDVPFSLNEMGASAKKMLTGSLDALVHRNAALAREVCAADEKVDRMNRDAYAVTVKAIRERPERTEYLLYYFGVARQLERIADHATNIAEDVLYMLDGVIVRHQEAEER